MVPGISLSHEPSCSMTIHSFQGTQSPPSNRNRLSSACPGGRFFQVLQEQSNARDYPRKWLRNSSDTTAASLNHQVKSHAHSLLRQCVSLQSIRRGLPMYDLPEQV